MKLKYADQKFGFGYKPKKDDYKGFVKIKREAKMTTIKGWEPEEEELVIPPFQGL